MGRIKSTMVKRAARQLMKGSSELFNDNFDHNKKALGHTMPSIPVRNKIAGYLARLVKMKNAPIKIKAKPVEDDEGYGSKPRSRDRDREYTPRQREY
ncbi:MAG: hypothetical protein AABX35_04150 [Nanoarchaeota archaeon]